jgi:undecaprenyl-diphosphooligosaccharide--protein glycosyltransferase
VGKSVLLRLRQTCRPLPVPRFVLLAGLLLALLAAVMNYTVRAHQYTLWQATPSLTQYNGASLVSTNDAGYFLSQARALKRAEAAQAEGGKPPEWRTAPLLSGLLARLAPAASQTALLDAGHRLLLVTAFVTALLVWAAFAALGWPLFGAVAALGGGLSQAYLVRSSVGRIDTDQLNLGLFYGLFALIFMAARQTDNRRALGWVLLAGLAGQLFYWWYPKAELIWMAAAALVWLGVIQGRGWLMTGVMLAGFLLLSGADLPTPWRSAYLLDEIVEGSLTYPQTFATITEIRQISLPTALEMMTGSWLAGLFCLAGIGLFGLRYPGQAIAAAPLFGFFSLMVFLGNRAVFYSAPALWFGGAFLLAETGLLLARRAGGIWPDQRVSKFTGHINIIRLAATCLALTIALLSSPMSHLPRPSFSPQIIAALEWAGQDRKGRAAVLASWWDYGYIGQFYSGLPVLHSPGSQTRPATHYVARALLSPDQAETARILSLLANSPPKELQEITASRGFEARLAQQPVRGRKDIYLLLTAQMAGWMSSISQLGNWDPLTGAPVIPPYNDGSAQLFYRWLDCHPRPGSLQLGCGQSVYDLEGGRINRMPLLARLVRAEDGFIAGQRVYPHPGRHILQTGIARTGPQSWLLHPQLFNSSFNQLFFLAQDNSGLFKLVYDDYPYARIYVLSGEQTL